MFTLIQYLYNIFCGLVCYCLTDYEKEIDINLIKNFEDI